MGAIDQGFAGNRDSEKAHRPRRGPFHSANGRKARESADAARLPQVSGKHLQIGPDSDEIPHD